MQDERNKKARVLAYYLPQFHPIPENDEWWGPGFTEWTNVAKAKPRFKGHVQPRIPADLGFYDLRLPETREKQAELAKAAGIEGFCYYHYWFGNGRQLLERPFNEVVESGKPDFPFCLCWANHTWGGTTWTNASMKAEKHIFMEQTYPGEEDNKEHFYSLLQAFKDKRYITVDGKLLFAIYDPFSFDGVELFIKQWRELAEKNGLPGFHFVGLLQSSSLASYMEAKRKNANTEDDVLERVDRILKMGFDAIVTDSKYRAQLLSKGVFRVALHSFMTKKLGIDYTDRYKQADINKHLFLEADKKENIYPTIFPNWDRTPRSNNDAILVDSTPEVFKDCLLKAQSIIDSKEPEHRLVFMKSWNEWGEGNYVEPDLQYGRGYLNALKEALLD
jgi:lipopolysaccharide biosynthesis protein